jgi:hypothetical protein
VAGIPDVPFRAAFLAFQFEKGNLAGWAGSGWTTLNRRTQQPDRSIPDAIPALILGRCDDVKAKAVNFRCS